MCEFHQYTMDVTKTYPDILKFGQIITSVVGYYIQNLCLLTVRLLLQWLEMFL